MKLHDSPSVEWSCTSYSGDLQNKPLSPESDAAAAIVICAFWYTEDIRDASLTQSSWSSCIIQSESIQRYRIPNARVTWTASLKVFVSCLKGMHSFLSCKFAVLVVYCCIAPQQWLRAAYRPDSPVISTSLRSITLFGSSKSSSRDGKSWSWLSGQFTWLATQSFNQPFATSIALSEPVKPVVRRDCLKFVQGLGSNKVGSVGIAMNLSILLAVNGLAERLTFLYKHFQFYGSLYVFNHDFIEMLYVCVLFSHTSIMYTWET